TVRRPDSQVEEPSQG
ncbi:hypothetical protein A2U01_0067129, partial [Trifolium medium]|nr:hypothetical protein [Trifolium medium]